ncbi:CBS domain-containing protein [Enhydrobacter aerosaccus]|uniref:CBS domain-containing protein n=2 Tax=Enhydrobacter aerosaccus TaxID=225324 RepID=A0A1T4P514_9HYPH|nr:CBS domain-containing protein [Enhydrobacter aerosaccus]
MPHYVPMQVSEIMTRGVETVAPDASLQQAASAMEALGVGSLPVCDGQRLVGSITDRDIVVRGVAAGLSPVETLVRDCMTSDIAYAFCDEEADEVLERMKTLQVRRLAVLDRDKSLVGIVALGDVATEPRAAALASVGAAVAEISEPSRPRK